MSLRGPAPQALRRARSASFGLGNIIGPFVSDAVISLFEILKMFFPPKGLCKAGTEGGPIVFTYVLICVRKRILDFEFTGGFLPF